MGLRAIGSSTQPCRCYNNAVRAARTLGHGVADAFGLEQLIELRLGEYRVAAKLESEPTLTIAREHRRQHHAQPSVLCTLPGRSVRHWRSTNWLKTNNG
jgi:hypothetical protein